MIVRRIVAHTACVVPASFSSPRHTRSTPSLSSTLSQASDTLSPLHSPDTLPSVWRAALFPVVPCASPYPLGLSIHATFDVFATYWRCEAIIPIVRCRYAHLILLRLQPSTARTPSVSALLCLLLSSRTPPAHVATESPRIGCSGLT
ncbi:hypothetical protein EVG20_g1507 [Dentipellis fragilis]|uniref:Uncharacterized protein n=1 Tax=Dentipellis fragilis TaxID=205917 RepID=A0A4Y9ZBZ1_9AGAM|nr:hypothetical protein EVG20_g1507 [Dentipellis fragilis]